MWSAVEAHIQKRAALYLFSAVLFATGTAFGAIAVNSMDPVQKQDLYRYVAGFFGQLDTHSSGVIWKDSLAHHVKIALAMWAAGLSIIGLPLIFIMLFLKGAVLGFTIGFLLQKMKWDGLLFAVGAILPHNAVLIPVFLFIAVMSSSCSIYLMERIVSRRHDPFLFRNRAAAGLAVFFLSGTVVAAAALIESFVSAPLMNTILK